MTDVVCQSLHTFVLNQAFESRFRPALTLTGPTRLRSNTRRRFGMPVRQMAR